MRNRFSILFARTRIPDKPHTPPRGGLSSKEKQKKKRGLSMRKRIKCPKIGAFPDKKGTSCQNLVAGTKTPTLMRQNSFFKTPWRDVNGGKSLMPNVFWHESVQSAFCGAAKTLKPCPFCGGTKGLRLFHGELMYIVFCAGCGVSGSYVATKELAAKTWNRRAKFEKER
jgi:Lar family restriction alleviation protein